MDINNVFRLLDAGFSKEEILAFEQPKQPEQPEQPKEPEQPEEPAAVDTKQFETALNNILKSFEAAVKNIQSANIKNSNLPEVKKESAEEILASIIAPPLKEKK